ncbi:MAG: ParB/RepB/Spo0J family partition protein [Clostridiales bacterium]|jgi:ParB family chromosome partitioning protein|nr:ParB/RepB/Spo0J family partition protein [Clostridiales bacterium]
MATQKKMALGRGITALIPDSEPVPINTGIQMIDINRIEPNKRQPRKKFDDEALGELAESIKLFGILQPLLVKEEDGFYSVIAGERRWRAARLAKLKEVPAIVKNYTDLETLQIALIENIQRQDLNPIEEAECFKKLIDEFFFSQEDIAQKVGRSRTYVTYAVGLLNLDSRIQEFIMDGKITPSHARVISQLEDPEKQVSCAESIIEKELSAREAERMILAYKNSPSEKEKPAKKAPEPDFLRIEEELKNLFGTKVVIHDGRKKGKIEIEYYSKDELDRLLLLFKNAR